jgi:hypothetical protein
LSGIEAFDQFDSGNAQLIVGFVIEGNAPKTVLLRGVGPGLVPAVAESAVLANPTLQLNKLDRATGDWTVVGSNDDWGDSVTLASAMDAVGMGALDPGSRDAALLLSLPPGIYTAQMNGVNATTGVGLIEIYEAPPAAQTAPLAPPTWLSTGPLIAPIPNYAPHPFDDAVYIF